MTPRNNAAWLSSPKKSALDIGPAKYPSPGENEIFVKNNAIAINPMDWMIQSMGVELFSWLQYPYIGGTDVADTVVEVGPGVINLKAGDRVTGLASGFEAREGALQEYNVSRANITTKIPVELDFTEAAVLPLGLCTTTVAH